MNRKSQTVDDFLLEVCDYQTLEGALEELKGQGAVMRLGPFSAEEWLINLQNHIIWGTIIEAGDEEMYLVAGFSLCRVAARVGIPPHSLPGPCGELAAQLLPEPERGD